MSVVNNIGALDGNVYLVRGRNDVNGATATDFDKIYNDITVDETEIFLGKKLKREDKNELALLGATNNVSAIKQ